jgi:hypothetical protein
VAGQGSLVGTAILAGGGEPVWWSWYVWLDGEGIRDDNGRCGVAFFSAVHSIVYNKAEDVQNIILYTGFRIVLPYIYIYIYIL